ncbi:MAG: efflux transporter outer membrane subunit [Planctomycetia bacterium]|nr:efflux transporter outer membrane subunit [Planctomycetia bacterium]
MRLTTLSSGSILASDRSGAGRTIGMYALVALLALATAGCMTRPLEYVQNRFKVGPNYKKSAAPVAEHWIDYQNSQVISEPSHNGAWWEVFGDPVLNDLTRRAYTQNLTLREAGLRVSEARSIRAVRVGNLFPQSQTANGSIQATQISIGTLASSGFGNAGAFAGSIDRNLGVFRYGTQMAWELDFWGRFRRSIESADAQLDASVENYDDVLVILLADVATCYVEIRTLEQRLRYARANVKYQTGSLDLADAKKREGVSSQLDIAQAQTNVAQTAAIIPQLEIRLRQAQNELCVLMGLPPQDLTPLLSQVESRIPDAPPEVALGVPADLIRRRPDIRRAEREVAAQSARIGIAEADMYPAFTITGSIFVQATQFQNLFQNTAQGGSFGPTFNWNIFNYGRIRNAVRAEEARYFQEVTQYQNAVLGANREAEDALIAFLRSQEQARILRQGAAAAEQSRDLVSELYKGGRADFGRVFFAEYFLVQQQDALAQSEGTIAQALVDLYRALGGGWQIRLGAQAGPAAVMPPPPAPPQPVEAEPIPINGLPNGGLPAKDAPLQGAAADRIPVDATSNSAPSPEGILLGNTEFVSRRRTLP